MAIELHDADFTIETTGELPLGDVPASPETPRTDTAEVINDEPPVEIPRTDPDTDPDAESALTATPAADRNADGTFKPKAKEAKKRIDHLTWEREQTRRENADLRARLEAIEARQRPAPTPAPQAQTAVAGDPEPKEEDFEVYRDYVKAQSRWEARQVLQAQQQQWQAQAQTASSEQFHAERGQQFAARLQTAIAADPNFLQGIHPAILALRPSSTLKPGERATPMHAVADALIDSDIPEALMRHWSEHFDDDFRRLLTLHPIQVIREIGKLEARLGPAPAGSGPTLPVLSQAKPPIKPVGSAPTTGEDEGSDDEPFDVFFKRENAKDAKARSRR